MEVSIDLPPENSVYKDPNYWDERFSKEESYEWLASYDEIKEILKETLDKFGPKSKILQLGCGNSSLALDLYNDGFEDVTNIDISEVCVKKMSSKHPQLKFVQMDMTDMTKLEFGEEKFDIVIEKSTLDALLVDTRSPWDFTSNGCQQVSKALTEVKNVLKVGGVFLSITFSQPHFRVPLLAQEGLEWSIKVDKFTTTGGVLDYFTFKCEAGDPSPAVEKWCVGRGPCIELKETWTSSDEEEFIMKVNSSCLASSSEEEEDDGSGGSCG